MGCGGGERRTGARLQRTDKVLGEAGSKAIRLGWMEEEHPQRRMITVDDYRSLAAKLRERQPIYPSIRVCVYPYLPAQSSAQRSTTHACTEECCAR